MAGDEGRIDTLFFDKLANQLIEHSCICLRRRALDVTFLEECLEEGICFLSMQLITRWKLLACCLLQCWDHLNPLPWRRPVNVIYFAGLGVESGLGAAVYGLNQTRYQVLCSLHNIVYVSIGLVEFACCELGVMC